MTVTLKENGRKKNNLIPFVPVRARLQGCLFLEKEQFVLAAHYFSGSPCLASLWSQGSLLQRWESGCLEQPAEIKQADNALEGVFCLSFFSDLPNTQHWSRPVSEELMSPFSNRAQQAGDYGNSERLCVLGTWSSSSMPVSSTRLFEGLT